MRLFCFMFRYAYLKEFMLSVQDANQAGDFCAEQMQLSGITCSKIFTRGAHIGACVHACVRACVRACVGRRRRMLCAACTPCRHACTPARTHGRMPARQHARPLWLSQGTHYPPPVI